MRSMIWPGQRCRSSSTRTERHDDVGRSVRNRDLRRARLGAGGRRRCEPRVDARTKALRDVDVSRGDVLTFHTQTGLAERQHVRGGAVALRARAAGRSCRSTTSWRPTPGCHPRVCRCRSKRVGVRSGPGRPCGREPGHWVHVRGARPGRPLRHDVARRPRTCRQAGALVVPRSTGHGRARRSPARCRCSDPFHIPGPRAHGDGAPVHVRGRRRGCRPPAACR